MPLDVADRLMIHELLARLDHAVDAQDWDGYLAHFDADAVMEPGFAPPSRGLAEIRAFLLASEANTSGKRHVASNVYVDGAGDEAVAHSYLTVLERQDIPRVVATALIVDTLRRREGRWKITRHQVSVDPGMFKAYAAMQKA